MSKKYIGACFLCTILTACEPHAPFKLLNAEFDAIKSICPNGTLTYDVIKLTRYSKGWQCSVNDSVIDVEIKVDQIMKNRGWTYVNTSNKWRSMCTKNLLASFRWSEHQKPNKQVHLSLHYKGEECRGQ